jgi:Quinohemoprotein amine dehydrogenase, alpha subunit domain III
MQPKITEITPESIPAGSSVMLRVKGKNLVGATVRFNRPGIDISPYATNKPTGLEIPIRVAPNMSPGDVKLEFTTPIGKTEASLKIMELQLGIGPTRREEKKRRAYRPRRRGPAPMGW